MVNVYKNNASREEIYRIQKIRLILIGVLTVLSTIELSLACLGLYVTMPNWLICLNIVFFMFNAPLIWWLLTLYVEQRRKLNGKQ